MSIRSLLRGRQQEYSVSNVAARTGLSRGHVASLRRRNVIKAKHMGLGDVMSLLLAQEIAKFGVPLEGAAAIAYLIKDSWTEVLASPNKIQYCFVVPTGGSPPYAVDVLTPGEVMSRHKQGAMTVRMDLIAQKVLQGARDHRPSAASVN